MVLFSRLEKLRGARGTRSAGVLLQAGFKTLIFGEPEKVCCLFPGTTLAIATSATN
jgi:hypothetical protein